VTRVDRVGALLALMPLLLQGFGVTLLLTALSIGLGTVFGTLLGCLYAWGGRVVRFLLFLTVTVVRGVPLVVQVFAVFFVLPAYGIKLSAITSAAAALTLFASFTIMEIVRGGINAVPRAQFQAALSLGFSFAGAMRTVVLPQALRSMIPSLVNQAVFMVKATSVVSLFGVTEFLYVSKEQIERTLMSFEIMAIVWIAYTMICYPLTVLGRRFEARLHARGQSSLAAAGA
jgi:His/Glu/Gln/Arg/opine family amino acid ABC transporter permease subunit